MKRVVTLLLLLIATALAAAGPFVPAGPVPDISAAPGPADPLLVRKIEPAALKAALTSRTARVIVELQDIAPTSVRSSGVSTLEARASLISALQVGTAASQQGVIRLLQARQQSGQVASYHPFWIVNSVATETDYATLVDLARRPEVVRIRQDRYRTLIADAAPVAAAPTSAGSLVGHGRPPIADAGLVTTSVPITTAEWNLKLIQADRVWNGLGITGRGAVVAIMDTGVDWLHPALAQNYRGYAPRNLTRHTGNWYDSTTEAFAYPGDGVGHGTSVAGVVLGNVEAGAVGVAPGAQWIGVKVFDNTGSSYDSWIHAGFEWILAPAGDPSLAPNIVNASWGKDAINDATFQPDLRALRRAGILPVFAAGNYGPNSSTLTAPGSLPEAFTVGATDNEDLVATFSSRGPSPFGVVKPDVVAPGVNVRTPMPGGGYHTVKGTSFSSPHVAGLAALIMEAKPGISIADVERTIVGGTVRQGFDVPSSKSGWGRIDAFSSVAAVASSGAVTGRVVGSDGKSIPAAAISLKNQASGATVSAVSDAAGLFTFAVSAGRYQVIASAFGYEDRADQSVDVTVGSNVDTSVVLTAKPRFAVSGRVTDALSGAGITATLSVVPGGWSVQASPSGQYSLELPVGTHTLRVVREGYRIGNVTVTIASAPIPGVDFSLARSPRILLVDSGAWYSDSHLGVWTDALDALNYVYTTRQLTDTLSVPTATDLRRYDIVVWSSPQDSPGLVGAQEALADFLDHGGKLLLSGQDVGFWDGGINTTTFYPYFHDYLHAEAVWDDSGSNSMAGVALEPLAGITVTLNAPDSAMNQKTPDVVRPVDGRSTAVLDYGSGTSAGLRANVCLPYQVLYFGFGWEGSGPRSNRIRLLQASLDWLAGVGLATPYQTSLDRSLAVAAPGKPASTALSIWNTTGLTETFDVSVQTGRWPAVVQDIAGRPITSTAPIGSCAAGGATVRVSVPYDVARTDSDQVVVTVAPRSNPAAAQEMSFVVRPRGYALLVDDSRFYNVRDRYEQALRDAALSYDVWTTAENGSPSAETLSAYPVVLWYTGYDWYDPLNTGDEQQIATYLDGGGRLILSSQDYLYHRGDSSFRIDRLGVLTYTVDITSFTVSGAVDSVVGGHFASAGLTTPYPEWSDVITPTATAATQFRNRDGGGIGIARYDATTTSKSLFLSFPFDGLERRPATELLQAAVGWFGGLSASGFAAEQESVQPGQEIGFALTIVNSGSAAAPVTVTNNLPKALRLLPASLQGAAADLKGAIVWTGTIESGATRVITYRAVLDQRTSGTTTNVATIESPGQTPVKVSARVVVPYRTFGPIVALGRS